MSARRPTLPGVSSLWTPEGERRVGAAASQQPPVTGPDEPPLDEDAAARLEELRGQIVATPVEVVVANHAYGLFELAAIHLSQQPVDFDRARLAIDAYGALVEGLAGRLGEAEQTLADGLAQLRLAYVQLQAGHEPGPGGSEPGGGGGDRS